MTSNLYVQTKKYIKHQEISYLFDYFNILPQDQDSFIQLKNKLTHENKLDTITFLSAVFNIKGQMCFSEDSIECSLYANELTLNIIKDSEFITVKPSFINNNVVSWNETDCMDFCYMMSLYDNFLLMTLNNFLYKLESKNIIKDFKFCKTRNDAIAPQKSRYSDSGFDLHLIEKIKNIGNVNYYDTGIAVEPPIGYYFDLVGRSSLSKTGWTIANNIGIIDMSYRGNIIVALYKHDKNAQDLELPIKLVQLIPRKLEQFIPIEVTTLNQTNRADRGFGNGSN